MDLYTNINIIDGNLLYYVTSIFVIPNNRVTRSVIAKLNMSQFAAVFMYAFLQIVKHVKRFPGNPKNDTVL